MHCKCGSPGRLPQSSNAKSTGSTPRHSPQELPSASGAKMPASRFLRTKIAPKSRKYPAAAPSHSWHGVSHARAALDFAAHHDRATFYPKRGFLLKILHVAPGPNEFPSFLLRVEAFVRARKARLP